MYSNVGQAMIVQLMDFRYCFCPQVTQEVPEETCDLQPERVCKHITKMVPM